MRDLLAKELYSLSRDGLWKIVFDHRIDVDDLRVFHDKQLVFVHPDKRAMVYDIIANVGFHIDIAPTTCKSCGRDLTYHYEDGIWAHIETGRNDCRTPSFNSTGKATP